MRTIILATILIIAWISSSAVFAQDQSASAFTRITLNSHNWEAHERRVVVEESGKCKELYTTPNREDHEWVEKKLDKRQLAKLNNLISSASLSNIKDKYSLESAFKTEHFTVTFETIRGTKVVEFHDSKDTDAPKELLEIAWLIKWCGT
jgi:hypothetical protein